MPYNHEKRVEMPDPKPVALPVGFQAPEPIHVMVQRLVQNEISRSAAASGYETFEEANNFNTGEDDPEPLSHAEKAAEFGDLLEASKSEILEAEGNIRQEMIKLEKTRKKLKEERERREREKIGGEEEEAQ